MGPGESTVSYTLACQVLYPLSTAQEVLVYCVTVCVYVFTYVYVCVTCAHSDCKGQKRTCDSPEIRVTSGCEPQYGF